MIRKSKHHQKMFNDGRLSLEKAYAEFNRLDALRSGNLKLSNDIFNSSKELASIDIDFDKIMTSEDISRAKKQIARAVLIGQINDKAGEFLIERVRLISIELYERKREQISKNAQQRKAQTIERGQKKSLGKKDANDFKLRQSIKVLGQAPNKKIIAQQFDALGVPNGDLIKELKSTSDVAKATRSMPAAKSAEPTVSPFTPKKYEDPRLSATGITEQSFAFIPNKPIPPRFA